MVFMTSEHHDNKTATGKNTSDKPQKARLDKLMLDKGLAGTRTKAQALILAGQVYVDEQKTDKPGTLVKTNAAIRVAETLPYVSRGGLKLEKALDVFGIDPEGRIALDIGASTGGFTDCLLQRGAKSVVAIDVGYGQLDWSLRNDSRVIVLEKTNIRHLTPETLKTHLATLPDLTVCDASFISLKHILPVADVLMRQTRDNEDGQQEAFREEEHPPGRPLDMVALIKPQFEHRDYVDNPKFKGVVTHREHHKQILEGVLHDLATLLPHWRLVNLEVSPITGPKGNIEFLAHWRVKAPEKPGTTEAPAPSDLSDLSGRVDEVLARIP